MPLNDPLTLLLIITPFGLMTLLLLCLSYVGLGKGSASLHWWVAGDLLLALYRGVAILQPGIPQGRWAWLPTFDPALAFVLGTTLLIAAIGAHTLALYHLAGRAGGPRWHLVVWWALPLAYAAAAASQVRGFYLIPCFSLAIMLAIAFQSGITVRLRRRYRGAWGLLAGQAVLLVFHGQLLVALTLHPIPPLPFERPSLPAVDALMMDFMVSFLFTLAYALALQEQLRHQVQRLSVTDPLTGALNRRGALGVLEREWQRARSLHRVASLAMLDLDHFKQVNDQYGHAVGDNALQAFAATVQRLKRRSDVFVRWGGEEFLLLLPATGSEEARQFMQRLREALRGLPLSPQVPCPIRFSAGLADSLAFDGQADFDSLLRAVDKALYRAKRQRDRIEAVAAVDF